MTDDQPPVIECNGTDIMDMSDLPSHYDVQMEVFPQRPEVSSIIMN